MKIELKLISNNFVKFLVNDQWVGGFNLRDLGESVELELFMAKKPIGEFESIKAGFRKDILQDLAQIIKDKSE